MEKQTDTTAGGQVVHVHPNGAHNEHDEQHRLQDVLPDIKDLAQKVGGMKRLAEIVAALDDSEDSR